jgi:hypothetical protein
MIIIIMIMMMMIIIITIIIKFSQNEHSGENGRCGSSFN